MKQNNQTSKLEKFLNVAPANSPRAVASVLFQLVLQRRKVVRLGVRDGRVEIYDVEAHEPIHPPQVDDPSLPPEFQAPQVFVEAGDPSIFTNPREVCAFLRAFRKAVELSRFRRHSIIPTIVGPPDTRVIMEARADGAYATVLEIRYEPPLREWLHHYRQWACRCRLCRFLSHFKGRNVHRFLIALLGIGLYYSCSWHSLRVPVASVCQFGLSRLGLQASEWDNGDQVGFAVGGVGILIDQKCTLLDLILIASPFLWVGGRMLHTNLLRLGMFAIVVETINTLRIIVAAIAFGAGGSWFMVHDVPYLALYLGLLGLVVVAYLRRNSRSLAGGIVS